MLLSWHALTRSTIARFIILIFLSQLTLTGGVLLFVRQSSEEALLSEQQALVGELRDELLAGYREGGEARLVEQIHARFTAAGPQVPVILLTGRDGRVTAGNLGAWPTIVPRSTDWQAIVLYRINSVRPEPMGVIATALPNGDHLLTGHVIEGSVRLRAVNREAMLAALAMAVPLALLLAIFLGRTINARVRNIADAAEAVGAGDLSHRVRQDGSGDSFDALGHGVNAMLDRIEALVAELRIVTDGLAHDLRSPITRLKLTLERAIVETRDPAASSALQTVSAEAETLLGMLSMALQIGRAEAGIGRDRFTSVDVATLLGDLVEIYGPVAEEQGIALSCTAPAGLTVTLHRQLLSQALGNLVENALKYADGGTRVALCASADADNVVFCVADDGPGIRPDRRAEALAKFGRLDPARNIAGSGLGLSLVEAVARLHGGTIELGDNAPGLKVTVTIRR